MPNGNLHIGHALNKIHKDVINRARRWPDATPITFRAGTATPANRMEGRGTLPDQKLNKDEVPVLEFRRECREYAQAWLDIQAGEFKRLGVAGDWANRYATMDFSSEAAIAGENR